MIKIILKYGVKVDYAVNGVGTLRGIRFIPHTSHQRET